MKSSKYIILSILFWLIMTQGNESQANTVTCARVKIEILQDLTLERVAFDARLVITNNLPDQSLENLSVRLDITDENGEDVSSLFFVKILSMDKINAVDGTSAIPPQVAAEIHWMLIPTPGAGGTGPQGRRYFVGGNVEFTANSSPQSMGLMPDMITVKPQPELVLDYFLPREVWADDPFTDPVEAPIPFTLGVRTKNAGYGPAMKLSITSGQPKIVENERGLLIDFRLIGSAVNDQPVTPTLNLVMGNIQPQSCSTGRWEMVTTLSGKFVEFNASYTHASELGGQQTSLIREVRTHFLTHEVLVDLPGSDLVRDYLAYDDPEGNRIPDTIYTSNCLELPVNKAQGTLTGIPGPGSPSITLDITPITGWSYTKVLDLAEGRMPLTEVIRSDGKKINPNNVWISEEKPTGKQADPSAFYLNLLDYDTTGRYTITYNTPERDTIPPATNIVIGDPKYGQNPIYVTSLTNFLFIATDDISGVSSMIFNLDNRGEEPAFPFKLDRLILPGEQIEGPHTISYYSIDRSGNREAAKAIDIFADDSPPVITQFIASPFVITPSAPDHIGFDRETLFSASATDATGVIEAIYEVASGQAGDDSAFGTLPVVRTMTSTLLSGIPDTFTWDGRNDAGNIVPAGTYTVRLTASDPLGHKTTAFVAVTIREFLEARAISASGADQMYPSIYESRIVWQDFRNDNWDIYIYDFSNGSLTNLTEGNIADQTRPSIDGDYVVWQDRTDGNWDIVLYDLPSNTGTRITSSFSDETMPAVKGRWIAYQNNGAGNQDIFAYNITTQETLPLISDTRDQINPVIDGNKVIWEDYRHGLGEIYEYDLVTGTEKRRTDNMNNQTHPTAMNGRVVWVDQRDGNRELYLLSGGRELRSTDTGTDEAQPYLDGNHLVYVDYASGLSDPNLSLMHMVTRYSMRLLSDPNRQEEPEISGNMLVWQDNRSGHWQIYSAEMTFPTAIVSYPMDKGFNLVAITRGLKDIYRDAFNLFNTWRREFDVRSISSYDAATGGMARVDLDGTGTPIGSNFSLVENGALFVYADNPVDVSLGDLTICNPLNLRAGFNLVSFGCVPEYYTVHDMIQSLGMERIISIQRFNKSAGRWVTAAVFNGAVVGENFLIQPGEGYIIYATGDIVNWTP